MSGGGEHLNTRHRRIDLFVNGTHGIEEYGEEDGWTVSASIFCEEYNSLYITVYRPNVDNI